MWCGWLSEHRMARGPTPPLLLPLLPLPARPRAKSAKVARSVACVRASTADRGSSAMSSFGSPYSARATASRCCWPPLSVTPRSPTSVCAPCASCLRSSASAQASMTCWRRSSSLSRPTRIFSSTVPAITNGFERTTATWPSQAREPSSTSASPQHAASSVDLPLPTLPVTATISPPRTVSEAPRSGVVYRPSSFSSPPSSPWPSWPPCSCVDDTTAVTSDGFVTSTTLVVPLPPPSPFLPLLPS